MVQIGPFSKNDDVIDQIRNFFGILGYENIWNAKNGELRTSEYKISPRVRFLLIWVWQTSNQKLLKTLQNDNKNKRINILSLIYFVTKEFFYKTYDMLCGYNLLFHNLDVVYLLARLYTFAFYSLLLGEHYLTWSR